MGNDPGLRPSDGFTSEISKISEKFPNCFFQGYREGLAWFAYFPKGKRKCTMLSLNPANFTEERLKSRITEADKRAK